MPADLAERAKWIVHLGSRAVQRVLADNRARGIASVFEVDGQVVYELPDGTRTLDDPFATPSEPRGDGR
jgi:hypothetical protein